MDAGLRPKPVRPSAAWTPDHTERAPRSPYRHRTGTPHRTATRRSPYADGKPGVTDSARWRPPG
ncbi:hypothetical protein [Rhizohabitans arisaemae]|uniref:hypothetical protein n=1 Tax=Rhizohabitans arisaemae TaxID=2720610 RepID=UPI0024B1AC5E|nr:hypothetical protein [Rhizohabitans arisaemae]